LAILYAPHPEGSNVKKVSDEEIDECVRQGLSPFDICRKLDIVWGSGTKVRIERACKRAGVSFSEIRVSNCKSKEEYKILYNISADRRVHTLGIKDGIILVGTDPHYCRLEHISTAHRAFCTILQTDIKQDLKAVILNGDIGDFGAVSRFPRGPWRNVKRPDIKSELEAVQARLGEIEDKCPRRTPLLRTLGNHDDRFEARLSAVAPEYEGMAGTRLKDHIPRWEECERIDINDDCEFIHNIKTGEFSRDRMNVLSTGHHTVVGHSHQLHVWPQTWRRGTFYGVCCGTLADLDDDVFQYLGSRPANWQSGFVVLSWYNGVMLYPEVATVIGNDCFFRGKKI